MARPPPPPKPYASEDGSERLGEPVNGAPRNLRLVCAWCQRVRTEQGLWERFETYLARGGEASFTHGMCPDCFEERAAF